MRFGALVLLFVLSASCSRNSSKASANETVLSAGQTIQATNKNGTIKVSYVGPLQRRYEWDHEQRTVTLIPRDQRFDGKLGLYEPADAWIFGFGKTRLVLDEAMCNFDSDEKLRAALVESSAYMDWVYTPDGLIIGFGRTASRKQVNIDVFQFLVRGQKPINLTGARPDQISVNYSK